ncbi:MAG: DedA family protein, partial [Minisyncoccota bacterium]
MFFGIDLTDLLQLVGYPGVFAIIFAESGLIVGFFLPGASLLFTAGLLAAAGVFNPFILIPLVTLAAILGDNV